MANVEFFNDPIAALGIIAGAAAYLAIYFSNLLRHGHEQALARAMPVVGIMLFALWLMGSS